MVLVISVLLNVLELSFKFLAGEYVALDLTIISSFGYYLLYTLPLTLINYYLFNYLNHKINWEKYDQRYRFVIGFVGSISLTLIALFLIRTFHKVVLEGQTYSEFLASQNGTFYLISLIITVVISLFFHVFYFYKALQENKVKEQKIIAGTASAKFESLKNQIDPHFLFNSLNVLTSLIEESPDNAQKFTTSLSKIYRYVLEQKDKELVSIEEELSFAILYMNLLKMRFEDSIHYEIPKELSTPNGKVVPLSLQLLLENTIKHNVVSEKKPLYIRIFEDKGYLIVENDYQKKEVLGARKGVGLQNIADRYSLITQREVAVEQNSEVFRVKLPILTKQFSVMETNQSNKSEAYFKAKQRVKEIKEFYGNLISYCVVIPFLIFINYMTYWGFQWFWFPLFGWGLGLTIHGFSVFGYGSTWEERKIKEIMAKDVENNKTWN
ncbi:hypothetical protein SAMN04487764_2291 [Gillisia sp. Hel1_33_143]|nr:hypothetical protein SAMN04487764_2291 [Gillisia sp. Hel1_33_143]